MAVWTREKDCGMVRVGMCQDCQRRDTQQRTRAATSDEPMCFSSIRMQRLTPPLSSASRIGIIVSRRCVRCVVCSALCGVAGLCKFIQTHPPFSPRPSR